MKHDAALILSTTSFKAATIASLKTLIDETILMRDEAMNYGDTLYANKEEIWSANLGVFKLCDLWATDQLDSEYKTKLNIIVDGNSDFPFDTNSLIDAEAVLDVEHISLFGFSTAHNVVVNLNDWYNFHRAYFIPNPPTRNCFCESLAPFFPNLFFNPKNVPQKLNHFINPSYTQVMKSIIYHLTAINDRFFHYFSIENLSGDRACAALEGEYAAKDIKIGSSRDGNASNELNIDFIDPETNVSKKIYCDLHTKFYQYFEIETPSPEQRSKRIYFDFPKSDFIPNKVLIGWIGPHRN